MVSTRILECLRGIHKGMLAAPDAILALMPGAQHILLRYSGEGDKQFGQVERWKTRTMRTKRRRNAERNEGVNRNLIQHIPSLDSCTLLNKAVDIVCYWS